MNEASDSQGTGRTFSIRPLGLGGVLDDGIQLWKKNFGVILFLAVVLLTPCDLVFEWVMAQVYEWLELEDAAFGEIFLYSLIPMVIEAVFRSAIISTLFEATLCHYLAHDYMGRNPGLRQSWRQVRRLWLRLVPIHVPFYLLYSFLWSMCIVPGLVFYAVFFVRIQVMVLEGAPPIAAFGRAARLMFNQWYVPVAIIFLLMTFYLPLQFLSGLSSVPWAGPVLMNAILNIVGSFEVCAATVFYFSVRAGRENVDLDLLAREVDTGPADAPVL